MSGAEASKWKEAVQKELNALVDMSAQECRAASATHGCLQNVMHAAVAQRVGRMSLMAMFESDWQQVHKDIA
jgi:hypothetical protein